MTLLAQFDFKGRQEQAATDPNPAIAVTAGAGSGKTLSLSSPRSDLLEPLAPVPPVADEKTRARESDPPQRVWRVVSQTKTACACLAGWAARPLSAAPLALP